MKRGAKKLGCLGVGLLLLAMPAAAQLVVGDNLKLGLSGDLSTGYNSSFGTGGSSHSLDAGGTGTLHGSYYSPQFFSFDVQPFYNRSQANSAFQSINNSSGLVGTGNFFTGSHFPGSVSYGKTSDTQGQFGLPGVTGLSTKASGTTYEINWAEAVPNRPSLNASYLLAGQDSSLYGSSSQTHFNSRSLNLQSNYALRGFPLNAFYTHQSSDSSFPSLLLNSPGATQGSGMQGSNSAYGFMSSHRIPLKGYWSGSLSRSSYSSETQSNLAKGSSNGTSNSVSSTASVELVRNLGVSVGASYQTNFLGALQAQLVQAGAVAPLRNADLSSQAISVRSDLYYRIGSHLNLNGQWNHIQQYIGGRSIGVSQFGGGVSSSYARPFLGSLTFSVGAMDTASQAGNSGASLYGNISFSRRIFHWETGADVNYAQQVQTLGSIYTTSVYGYGGAVKRKFGDKFYWSSSARETHSGLAQQAGSSSHSGSFSTSVTYRKYSGNAVYSESGGTAILTAQGLVAVPIGVPLPFVASSVLYNAKSYGGGISATILRFSLTGSYSQAMSDTTAANLTSNSTTMWNALIRCRMRKLYLNAGYTRFGQNVGAPGAQPSVVNSYYFGISRWFNVF